MVDKYVVIILSASLDSVINILLTKKHKQRQLHLSEASKKILRTVNKILYSVIDSKMYLAYCWIMITPSLPA